MIQTSSHNTDMKARFFWPSMFCLSFIAWIYCFHGFLLNKLNFTSDALVYFEHFKFFIENITEGRYPMWEPNRMMGMPVEFFMRRIGSFNPTYLFLGILHKAGIPFVYAYIAFITGYFFFGMIGFYLIAQRIFQNRSIAFFAYLVLMFSSLATRNFDSFVLLTIIPMIWFFYFFIAFFSSPKIYKIIGMALCLMVLLTTYIPFYFLIIFCSFLIFLACFYFRSFIQSAKGGFAFLGKERVVTFLCAFSVCLSLIPGYLFFKDGNRGELILKERQATSADDSIIGVGIETATEWGIEEDIAYASSYNDLRQFKFAVVYVPGFALLVLILGFWMRITRLTAFFFVWLAAFLLVFSHHAPIYKFLHEQLFFFKYFRNLHFFLWMIGLLLFSLLAASQLKDVIEQFDKKNRAVYIVYLTVVHALVLIFLPYFGNPIGTTYATIMLSYIFFLAVFLQKVSLSGRFFSVILLVIGCLQPLEAYQYFQRNAINLNMLSNYSTLSYSYLDLKSESQVQGYRNRFLAVPEQARSAPGSPTEISVYVGTRWYVEFLSHINRHVVDFQKVSPFMIYDSVQSVSEPIDYGLINQSLANNKSTAFIHSEMAEDFSLPLSQSSQATIISQESSELRVKKFDINSVRLQANFASPKFLAYNDCFYEGWQAFIDGKPASLYRTNIAFKGLWIPAGEHEIFLRYGAGWKYFMNWGFIGLFQAMFWLLVFLRVKDV